eukprot:TRINITY_DN16261_c0_g1_i1.p1 TRINITY_DN16261_c0_g1~~TRINITY_DN16261_c0_g1_i1.p1  ORF type:complete len:244 (+),score=35.43 TRINITY_DN16261_c0_g1_i1:96-827(+)
MCIRDRIFPYLVLVYAYVINASMPAPVASAFEHIFVTGIKTVFRMKTVELDAIDSWPRVLHGPARQQLPDILCSALFMRGNPAHDAIGDPTYGEWDPVARTLTMPLWKPQVWSWNDDYEGAKLFYGAWAMGMKYVFYFDENIEHARIRSPILGGTAEFTDLMYGKGSQFLMNRQPGKKKWTRRSLLSDGSQAFADYYPTLVATCQNGVEKQGFDMMITSLKDHKAYDPEALSGGASARQMLRY